MSSRQPLSDLVDILANLFLLARDFVGLAPRW